MRFGLSKFSRRSMTDIEQEAAAEIEQRVSQGKPPAEDFVAVNKKLAELDARGELTRIPATETMPAPKSTNGHGLGHERSSVELETHTPSEPLPAFEPADIEPAPAMAPEAAQMPEMVDEPLTGVEPLEPVAAEPAIAEPVVAEPAPATTLTTRYTQRQAAAAPATRKPSTRKPASTARKPASTARKPVARKPAAAKSATKSVAKTAAKRSPKAAAKRK